MEKCYLNFLLLSIVYTSGLVYDLTQDFNNSFYFASILGFIGAALSAVIVIKLHCCKPEEYNVPEQQQPEGTPKNKHLPVASDEFGSQILYTEEDKEETDKRTGDDRNKDVI